MMKKIAGLVGAGALLLSAAVPALAWGGWNWWGSSSDTAIVTNTAVSSANTGLNSQGNGVSVVGGDEVEDVTVGGSNTMTTGDASSYAGALVVANTHVGCDLCSSGGRRHEDFALVDNFALSGADTGLNGQGNGVSVDENDDEVEDVTVTGNNWLSTGDANSTARAWVVVNTHWAW